MYGLIGKMKCMPGQRDTLISILLEGVSGMPGCLSYVVAKDPTESDSIWITEAWETQALHKASLSLQSVQAAITKARPLISGFGERFETRTLLAVMALLRVRAWPNHSLNRTPCGVPATAIEFKEQTMPQQGLVVFAKNKKRVSTFSSRRWAWKSSNQIRLTICSETEATRS